MNSVTKRLSFKNGIPQAHRWTDLLVLLVIADSSIEQAFLSLSRTTTNNEEPALESEIASLLLRFEDKMRYHGLRKAGYTPNRIGRRGRLQLML